MRFVALGIIILAVPIFVVLLRQDVRIRRLLYFSVGLMPFVIAGLNLDAAVISWAFWQGQTKGMILSLLDALALAIVINGRRNIFSLPFIPVILAYIIAAAITIVYSGTPQASFFYVWQLCTVMLVCAATIHICKTKEGPKLIIAGLVCGVALQAGFAINQKFSGVLQARGTMGHQNLLGMVTHFALYPALALIIASGKARLPLLGVIAGLIVVSLGASRATIGLAGIGIVLLVFLSILRHPTARKTKVASIGMLALAVATPLALYSLEQRFAVQSTIGSNEERQAFNRAARMIWADHPMGVGANTYVIIANTGGYSERAGVIWNYTSRSAKVHNAYLLVAAETGFIGLIAFLAFMFTPLVAAFRFAWADRKDPRGDLALGIGVTWVVLAAHSFYEWVLVTSPVQYLMGIGMGVLGGLILQRRAEKRHAILQKRQALAQTESSENPVAVAGS